MLIYFFLFVFLVVFLIYSLHKFAITSTSSNSSDEVGEYFTLDGK